MINVGIIGCGKIAQVRHIPEYETNENARICGFYDINQERARPGNLRRSTRQRPMPLTGNYWQIARQWQRPQGKMTES